MLHQYFNIISVFILFQYYKTHLHLEPKNEMVEEGFKIRKQTSSGKSTSHYSSLNSMLLYGEFHPAVAFVDSSSLLFTDT